MEVNLLADLLEQSLPLAEVLPAPLPAPAEEQSLPVRRASTRRSGAVLLPGLGPAKNTPGGRI